MTALTSVFVVASSRHWLDLEFVEHIGADRFGALVPDEPDIAAMAGDIASNYADNPFTPNIQMLGCDEHASCFLELGRLDLESGLHVVAIHKDLLVSLPAPICRG